jgi:hypothetical protein
LAPILKILNRSDFELFEGMHRNVRIVLKGLPEMFPGIAEMMEYVYKVREEYFEGDYIQYIC